MSDLILFPETLSTSRDIELFAQCNYKWFVQRCQRFTKYVYNNDLEAGGEFAAAMEITRNSFYKEGLSELEAVELGKKSILVNFGRTYAEAEYKDELKTPEKMAEVFEKMFQEHPMETNAIVPFEMEDGTLSVEQDFTIELPILHPEFGTPLKLKCKLDMLGIKDNTVYVVDEKTCKSVLLDDIKQTDLLRTQNQFVQYVTVGNMCKERFGNLDITHVRINRCKIKKSYTKGETVVAPYEFTVDAWFQRTWWNNLLYLVNDMVRKYEALKLAEKGEVVFPRAYGNACTSYFKPCALTYHCTSGNAQNLLEQGWSQVVCDSSTGYTEVPLHKYIAERAGK